MSIQEFQEKILPLKNKLFGLAYSIMGNRTEAEDAVQEALIKLWKMRERLPQIENLEGWCMRVQRNMAIDLLRRRPKPAEAVEERWDLADQAASPQQMVETQDELQQIEKLMEQLPEKQRIIIKLRDVQGYSYKEISQSLDMSMSQVKVYLHRARQHMRKLLIAHTKRINQKL